MVFVAALVALHVAVFAWSALDESTANIALPLVQCALAIAAFSVGSVRRAVIEALGRYWPAALSWILVSLIAIEISGVLSHDAAPDGGVSRRQAWGFVGFGMDAIASVGAALAFGRRQVQGALLIGSIALGGLALIEHAHQARPLLAAPDETGALFGVLMAFSVYAGLDAYAAPPAQPLGRRSTRAERLTLPAGAFGSCLIGMWLANSVLAFACAAAALAILCALLALRERQRRSQGALVAFACAALVVAAALFVLARHAENPSWTAALSISPMHVAIVAAWIPFLARLALSQDRRRRPSRGFALAMAGASVTALIGADAPAALATTGLIVGVAGAHADALAHMIARVSAPARSSDQT